MQKSESPPDDQDKRDTELAQILREIEQLDKEMRARVSLIQRRLKVVLGGKRTAGPKVFEFHRADGKVQIIKMRGLADD